jgi:hypothetical protein
MKRGVLVIAILFVLLLSFSLVIAQENDSLDDGDLTIDDSNSDSDNKLNSVDKAYQCLEDKVDDADNCGDLALEEQIFSLLAIGGADCRSEVQDASDNDECWPDGNCNIKTTAQAILALSRSSGSLSTGQAEDWLAEQNTSASSDLTWFLEIDSNQATTCSISYSGQNHNLKINANKKLESGAGSCLARSDGDYWLRIAPNCFEEEFSISCDQGFLTTLLYRKKSASTIFVSEQVNSASAEGTTKEQVNSLCFKNPGSSQCDYEGSLWAALTLDAQGESVNAYIPYLVALADENPRLLPEAFLYTITDFQDFFVDLLASQKSSQFWEESGDKFYDTALALLALQNDNAPEKSNAVDWLLEPGVQDANGCWKGNVRNTAFLLYAGWPRSVSSGGGSSGSCQDSGFYCHSSSSCVNSGGGVLTSYECPGVSVCCDQARIEETCSEKGGNVCNSNQVCSGTELGASDLEFGESCCFDGSCRLASEGVANECEDTHNGICRQSGCLSGEQDAFYTCEFTGDSCCVASDDDPGGIPWYVWLLVILIILAILGIIFRNKLRPYWMRVKSKFKKGKGPGGPLGGRPGPPPGRPFDMGPGPPRTSNRFLPPPGQIPRQPLRPLGKRKPKTGIDKDFEDTLKKLKDIGK